MRSRRRYTPKGLQRTIHDARERHLRLENARVAREEREALAGIHTGFQQLLTAYAETEAHNQTKENR